MGSKIQDPRLLRGLPWESWILDLGSHPRLKFQSVQSVSIGIQDSANRPLGRFPPPPQRSAKFNVCNSIDFGRSLGGGGYALRPGGPGQVEGLGWPGPSGSRVPPCVLGGCVFRPAGSQHTYIYIYATPPPQRSTKINAIRDILGYFHPHSSDHDDSDRWWTSEDMYISWFHSDVSDGSVKQ